MAVEEVQIVTDINGKQKYRLEVALEWEYPYDPNSPMVILWAPAAGVGQANLPFMVKGDNGVGTRFLTDVENQPELEWNDPTPAGISVAEVTPADQESNQPQVLKLINRSRKGAPGQNGTSVLDPDAYGTKIAGRIIELYLDEEEVWQFRYTPQRVGGQHPAASLDFAPEGTSVGKTIGIISVPANTYAIPWRPDITAGTVVVGSTTDVRVDIVARLGTEDGPVIGRGYGVAGVAADKLVLINGPDPGSPDANLIAPNAAATIYVRVEKQEGAATFQSLLASTRINMMAIAQP